MASADILLFAIRGALKLGQQVRAAYVDSTRNRELILPLPDFPREPSVTAAASYFRDRDVSGQPTQLQELVRKLKAHEALSPDEQKLLMLYHEDEVLKGLPPDQSTRTGDDGSRVSGLTLSALVTIRQWQRGSEPEPSALQRLAGTFLEIGIDYFVSMPGGLDPNSRTGKGLRAFLAGFDELSFATEPLSDLPAKMFSATMESIAANPSLLTHDPKVQELITAATGGLAADVSARIAEHKETQGADPDGEARIRDWGELAFRSVLGSVGKRIANDPTGFLGVAGEANAALVKGVANAAISVVLDQPEGHLENAFSQPGLERVADAALDVVVRHPELLAGESNRLRPLVSQIAADLAAQDRRFGNQAVPEITRIVLARTAENLPLLWPGAADPGKNLALTAARTTLEILSRKAADGEQWKPEFDSADLTAVAETVLGQLVRSPGWLISKPGELSGGLAAALEAMVGALRRRGDARLSTALAVELLKAGLGAAALRIEFLTKMTKNPDGELIVGALLNAVLQEVLAPGADAAVQWRLVKDEVIVGLFGTASKEVARTALGPATIGVVQKVLADNGQAIRRGEAWDLNRFASELGAALSAA